MEILTSAQMRHIDRRAAVRFGIPEILLMENAGLRLFEFLCATWPDLQRRRVLLLCGRGNNGGDAWVLARHLRNHAVAVRAILFGRPAQVSGSAAVNLRAAARLGLEIETVTGPGSWRRARRRLRDADLLVDGILGTGLSRPVGGLLARAFGEVNASRVPLVAVDVPSGLSGDSGSIPGPALVADHTLTFARPKWPHVFLPARGLCGRVVVADVSIPGAAVAQEGAFLELIRPEAVAATLPARRPESHKGDFGHLLLLAGARGKAGAARMAALAALRAGCGLVTVALPRSLQARLVQGAMEAMTEGLEETTEGTIAASALPRILGLLRGKDAIAIGPGLTTHPETKRLVRALVARVRLPMVLDADGLNAFAGDAALLSGRRRPLLLTPHPGEMGRLLGRSAAEVQADRVGLARGLARRRRCHVVLKGHRTLVASPDGRVGVNSTGNPGLAKGGSGDVLTGFLGGLLAQGLAPESAARAAVHLHGLAADLASARVGETPLLARDVLSEFPRALRRLSRSRRGPSVMEVLS